MRFKIDENLPTEYASMLRDAGFDADAVGDEKISGADDATVFEYSQIESRTLIALDLDFSNLQVYPCQSYAGIVILRTRTEDKSTLVAILRRLILVFQDSHRSSNFGSSRVIGFGCSNSRAGPTSPAALVD